MYLKSFGLFWILHEVYYLVKTALTQAELLREKAAKEDGMVVLSVNCVCQKGQFKS